MGHIMTRAPEEVREKALEVAVAKYDAGCENCSQAYLDLARRSGATEGDARRAGMGRRGFLKLAALVFGAAVVGSAGVLLGPRVARAFPSLLSAGVGGYFGVDSCTSLVNAIGASMPVQFYIAEIGAGANGLNCLDPQTAGQVGSDYAHGYWGLCGPHFATDPADPYAYGRQQALDALKAIAGLPAVNGQTLFADVEYGFGGWADGATPAQHAAVLDGFLETVAAAQFVPGVYINNSSRDDWFPASYTPRVPFVYWLAGGEWAGTMCAPCDATCDTLTPTRDAWNNSVSQESFGGQYAALWQYWLSDFGCGGDFTFSPQSGYQTFTPLSSPASVPTPSPAPATPTSTPTSTGTPGM